MPIRILSYSTLVLCLAVPLSEARSQIKRDEMVVFFPTMASRQTTAWRVPIHGWIFEPEEGDPVRLAAVASLRETLGLDGESARSVLFERRIGRFLADNEEGKELELLRGDEAYRLPPSASDGHIVAELAVKTEARWLELRAVTHRADRRSFVARSRLLEQEGLTIISDVDDTVKVSEVGDSRALLRRTFVEPFEAVPGMAEAYGRWMEELDAHLHFLSSSPWQLYEPLARFLEEAGFPEATFDLKRVHFKGPGLLDLFADPVEIKSAAIEAIVARFPRRRYILVGDSGEADPEVYGEIARRHPERIAFVFIRDVNDEGLASRRLAAAFENVPPEKWSLFTEGSELPLAVAGMTSS